MNIKWKKKLRVRPLIGGYDRQWIQCKECSWVGYYDYIPYSLATPIMSMKCGHDFYSKKHHRLTVEEVKKDYKIVEVPYE